MLIIGIAGGTGSGKTTVVNQIIQELNIMDISVIYQDDYYKDLSHISFEERTKVNFDHPQSIDFDLLVDHLKALKKGSSISQPVYSFKQHNRTGKTRLIEPKKVMIVEGILLLNNQKLRELFDVKIFVHADSDERLIRRIKRDIHKRGRALDEVISRYQKTLKPMHLEFIEPSKEFADIIIPNNKFNNVAIEVVRTLVKERLV
ncbi:MAG: uridine kinase [Psychroflexus sp.]|jgi:uridine kinase|nr:uridine kinase [Psychroflexus sp.]MDR9449181.1 uridine kinase [Psychroflexus sp.]